MSDKKIAVVLDGSLSSPMDKRYIIIDIETGEVIGKYQGKSKLVEYLKENDNYTDFYSKLEKLLNES